MDDNRDSQQVEEEVRPSFRSGRVRIVGAEPADPTLSVPLVSDERDLEPRLGGPSELAGAVDPTIVPSAPDTAMELPHWTEAPTGEVPAVLARDNGGSGGEHDRWASLPKPSWREGEGDWDAGADAFEPSMLGDGEPGILSRQQAEEEERQPWTFDLPGHEPTDNGSAWAEPEHNGGIVQSERGDPVASGFDRPAIQDEDTLVAPMESLVRDEPEVVEAPFVPAAASPAAARPRHLEPEPAASVPEPFLDDLSGPTEDWGDDRLLARWRRSRRRGAHRAPDDVGAASDPDPIIVGVGEAIIVEVEEAVFATAEPGAGPTAGPSTDPASISGPISTADPVSSADPASITGPVSTADPASITGPVSTADPASITGPVSTADPVADDIPGPPPSRLSRGPRLDTGRSGLGRRAIRLGDVDEGVAALAADDPSVAGESGLVPPPRRVPRRPVAKTPPSRPPTHRQRPLRPPAAATVQQPEPGRNLSAAALTGGAMLVLALVAFHFGGLPAMVVITALVFLAAAEAYAAFRRGGYRPATLLGLLATVSLMVATYNKGQAALPLLIVLLFAFTVLWYLGGVQPGAPPIEGTASTLFVFCWVGVFGSFAALLLDPTLFPDRHGIAFLLGGIITGVACDIGALVFGGWLGRHPLAPAVSPNKTWEGAIGGAACAVLAGVVVVHFIHPWTLGKAAVLGIVVAIVSPLGDLSESLVKRHLGLKDMGRMLPGHGGMLDRVDGLLFVLPATYFLVKAFHLG